MPNKKANSLKIEYVPINKLKEWDRNPRKNDETVAALVKSIERFGYTNPILVRRHDRRIIAGHTRVKALQQMGETHVPAIFLNMPDGEADLYALFDNKSVENTPWDIPKLSELFGDLSELNLDLELTGFSPDEISSYMDQQNIQPNPQDDVVPEPPKKPVTKIGDLWILGNHRLLCGDSTKEVDVKKLMGKNKADMVFTDPPYKLSSEGFGTKLEHQYGKQKANQPPKYEQWMALIETHKKADFNILIFEFWKNIRELWTVMEKWFDVKNLIIWFVPNRHWTWHVPYFYSRYDIILWGVTGKYYFNFDWLKAGNTISDVIEHSKSSFEESGQNQIFGSKPVAILEPYIQMLSKRKSLIYEPFCGSGSTLIACEKLNRHCFGMEIEPAYCDVTVERWENFTGQKAILQKPNRN